MSGNPQHFRIIPEWTNWNGIERINSNPEVTRLRLMSPVIRESIPCEV